MTPRSKLAIGLGVAGALALGTLATLHGLTADDTARGRRGRDPASAPEAEELALLAPAEGVRHRYRLHLDSEHAMALPGELSISSTAALEAELYLSGRGTVDGRARVELGFLRVDQASARLGGMEALSTPAELVGPAVLIELAPDGTVTSLRSQDTPEAVIGLLRLIVQETQVRRLAGERWEATESDRIGTGLVRYRAGGARIDKQRVGYDTVPSLAWLNKLPEQSVVARGSFLPASDGGLTRAEVHSQATLRDDTERLRSRLELTLERVGTDAAALPIAGLAELPGHPLDEMRLSQAASDAALRDAAGNMTWNELVSGLGVHASGSTGQAHNRWITRAVSLVELKPELARALGKEFREDHSKDERLLTLDVLTSAGHAEAQRVLRELLADPLTRGDQDFYVQAIQRLSLLQQPDAEMAAFALAEFQRTRGHPHHAATYALGSVAFALGQHGDERTASDLAAELRGALPSSSPRQQQSLLEALGNAGRDDSLETLELYASSPDAGLRLSATSALRKLTGLRVEAVLVMLAADPYGPVQRLALDILGRREVSAPGLAALATALRDGRILATSYLVAIGCILDRLPGAERAELALLMMGRSSDAELRAALAERAAT